jgi:thymidine phosphorylase
MLSGIETDIAHARETVETKIAGGEGLECLRENIELQGGDPHVCDRPEMLLTSGLYECVIDAPISGYVSGIDTFRIGNAMVDAGGGRTRAEDSIDHSVGFEYMVKIGQQIKSGETLCIAYCLDESAGQRIRQKLTESFRINDQPGDPVPTLIRETIR